VDDQTLKLIRDLQKTYGHPNPKRALTPPEIASGLTTITLNAADLLDDARTLSAEHRYPRAGSLVILALEELAKVPALFAVAIGERTGTKVSWPDFWSGFSKHSVKQDNIAKYGRGLRTGDLLANDGPYAHYLPDELGRILDIYKQRNFYVDFTDGGFTRPGHAEVAPGGSVDQLLVLAEERSDSFARLHGTERRSAIHFDWVCRSVDLVKSGATSVPVFGPAESMDASQPHDVQIEIHSLVAHRSSALLPDYRTVYGIGGAIAKMTSDAVFKEAVQAEADVLGRRMQLAANLPASATRAYLMFKLLYGLVLRLGLEPPSLPEPPVLPVS
jgi:AbiV family abortive infection protein